MTRRGYTLMEVLMALVIIGIIAAFALPQYTKTMEQTYWRQARDILMTIYWGEKYYALFNGGTYLTLTPVSPSPDWLEISMDDPNRLPSFPVQFEVLAGVGTFLGRATRTGAGGCGGRELTINHNMTIDDSDWPSTGVC